MTSISSKFSLIELNCFLKARDQHVII